MAPNEMRVTAVCHGSLKSIPLKVDGNIAGRSCVTHQDQNAIIVREEERKKRNTIFNFVLIFPAQSFFYGIFQIIRTENVCIHVDFDQTYFHSFLKKMLS